MSKAFMGSYRPSIFGSLHLGDFGNRINVHKDGHPRLYVSIKAVKSCRFFRQ